MVGLVSDDATPAARACQIIANVLLPTLQPGTLNAEPKFLHPEYVLSTATQDPRVELEVQLSALNP